MSSAKSKKETITKVETCCSEPAKRKLLIKIGIGVGVGAVLLVVIIAVAVVMATRSEDSGSIPNTGSNSDTQSTRNSSTSESTTTTTVSPPSTTEPARVVTVAQSRIDVNLPDSVKSGGKEILVLEEDTQTQWVYYDTDDYAIYIIQKFREGTQTIVATTRRADDLDNNYNGTILFCEESPIKGTFPTQSQIQESQTSEGITTQTSSQSLEAPSVILPLQTGRCSSLPDRLRYKPDMKTTVELLGPVCSSLVSTDISDANNMTFSGDQCTGASNLEEICGCYKQCLDCTFDRSRAHQQPDCKCASFAVAALDRLSCSGTEDDGQCAQDKEQIRSDVENNPCSCSFGVYFSYPCGVEPAGCQGSDCTLSWCFHGIQYQVGFNKMCENKGNTVQCTNRPT